MNIRDGKTSAPAGLQSHILRLIIFVTLNRSYCRSRLKNEVYIHMWLVLSLMLKVHIGLINPDLTFPKYFLSLLVQSIFVVFTKSGGGMYNLV